MKKDEARKAIDAMLASGKPQGSLSRQQADAMLTSMLGRPIDVSSKLDAAIAEEAQRASVKQSAKARTADVRAREPKVTLPEKDARRQADDLKRRVEAQGADATPKREKSVWERGLTSALDILTRINALGEAGAEVMHGALTESADERALRKQSTSLSQAVGRNVDEAKALVEGAAGSDPVGAFVEALVQGKSRNHDLASDYGWKHDPDAPFGAKVGRGAMNLGLSVLADPTSFASVGTSAITKSVADDVLGDIALRGALSIDDAAKLAPFSKPIADDLARSTSGVATKLIGKNIGDLDNVAQARVQSAVKRMARSQTGETLLHTRGRTPVSIVDGMSGTSAVSRAADELVAPLTAIVGPKSGVVTRAGSKAAARAKNAKDAATKTAAANAMNTMRKGLMKSGLTEADARRASVSLGDSALAKGLMDDADALLKADVPTAGVTDSIAYAKQVGIDLDDVVQRMSEARQAASKGKSSAYTAREAAGAKQVIADYVLEMRKTLEADDVADFGAGYVLGKTGGVNPLTGKLTKDYRRTLAEFGIDPDTVDRGAGISARELLDNGSGSLNVAGKKTYATSRDRLERGNLATELDLSKLAYDRISKSGDAKTKQEFIETVYGMGQDVTDGVKSGAVDLTDDIVNIPNTERYVRMAPGLAQEVKRVMDTVTTPERMGFIGRQFENAYGWWKKWALATPGFFMRNAFSNMVLLDSHSAMTAKTLKEGWEHVAMRADGARASKVARTIGDKSYTWGELDDMMRKLGVMDSGQLMELKPDDALVRAWEKANPTRKYTDAIHFANSKVENSSRATAFLTGLDRGLTPEQAAAFVDRVLYDYNPASLTQPEQALRRYIVPFYTWMRRNIPNQVSIAFNDPAKISRFKKLMDAGYVATGLGSEDPAMADYQKELGLIPLPTPNGGVVYFNPNFGQQDLMKIRAIANVFTGDSLAEKVQPAFDELMAVLIPFIKVPIEIGMNRDSFYQSDLHEYPGQMVEAHPLIGEINRRLGYPLPHNKETGATLIEPEVMKVIQFSPIMYNILRWTDNGENDYSDGFFETTTPQQRGRLASSILGVKLYPHEPEKWAENAAYDDREQYQNTLSSLRDTGRLDATADEDARRFIETVRKMELERAKAESPEYQAWMRELEAVTATNEREALAEKVRRGGDPWDLTNQMLFDNGQMELVDPEWLAMKQDKATESIGRRVNSRSLGGASKNGMTLDEILAAMQGGGR